MTLTCMRGFAISALLMLASAAQAVQTPLPPEQIKIDQLLGETQKSSSSPDTLDLVWWIPPQFWDSVLSSNKAADPTARKQVHELFSQYTVVAVAHGKLGVLGVESFMSEADIRANLRLLDANGVVYEPIAADKVDTRLGLLIQAMKPVFTNIVGQLGANINFFAFPANGKDGKPLADPFADGRLVARMREQEYVFRLPLGSLLTPKRDARTGEVFPGSYDFNPYTGAALQAVPAPR